MTKKTRKKLDARTLTKNPILDPEGNCFGLCSNFTLYCIKHWNEKTEDILNGWNDKLERNIYAEHPSDRFAERTHQYQFMKDPLYTEKTISTKDSFIQSLFEAKNGESESPGSNMIGLVFPLGYETHIIEIIKREDGYLIYDPNDDKLRFAATKQEADRIINSRAREENRILLTDFHITAMDEYLRKIGMINEDRPRQKDGKFPAQLAPAEMIALHKAIAKDYNGIEFRSLLNNYTPEALKSAYSDGVGIIRYATKKNNLDAVKALLEKGAYTLEDLFTIQKSGRQLIHDMALSRDTQGLKTILTQDPPLDDQSIWTSQNKHGETTIDFIATSGNTEILELLLKKYHYLATTENFKRVTAIAAYNNDTQTLKYLLNLTPPLDESIWNSEDSNKKTSIDYIVERGNIEILEILLEKYGNLIKVENFKKAITIVATGEDSEILRKLSNKYHNNPNFREILNQAFVINQLWNTIKNSDNETLDGIVKQQPPLDPSIWTIRNTAGETIAHRLIAQENEVGLQKVLSISPNLAREVAFDIANNRWNSENQKTLLITNPELANLKDEQGATVAYKIAEGAMIRKSYETIKMLLNLTPPIEESILSYTPNEYTPPLIHLVAKGDDTEILEMLLTKYPDLANLKDKQGATVTYIIAENALRKHNYGTIEMLLNRTPPIDESTWSYTPNKWENPLVHEIAMERDTKILKRLLDKYPNLAIVKNTKEKTITHAVLHNENLEAFEMLLKYTPPLNLALDKTDNRGYNAMDIITSNPQMLEILLENRPDLINILLPDGKMPLEFVASNCESDISTIKTLINHGAKIDQNDDGTLDYKINFFQNEIKQASAKAELYTKILEFLQEKKIERQNSELVEEAKDIGRNIAPQMTITREPTGNLHSHGGKNEASKNSGIT